VKFALRPAFTLTGPQIVGFFPPVIFWPPPRKQDAAGEDYPDAINRSAGC
jgi:hypothetical protein